MPALLETMRPRVRDVVGLDLGSSGMKAVRLRCDRSGRVTVLAADVLPPLRPPATEDAPVEPLHLPKPLQARAAAFCFTSTQAVCKLLTIPGGPEKVAETVFSALLGLPRQSTFRCFHKVLDGESRAEALVLAVGVPESEASWLAALLAKGGPAPCAAELAGLAAMTAYRAGPGAEAAPRCDLVLDAGAAMTTLAVFFKGRPLVVRQFPQGATAVVNQVMHDLHVDEPTARDILDVGSIDARSSVHTVYESFLRQLAIAIDFAERRSGQRLQKIFLTGGLAANRDWREELKAVTGVAPETWKIWENMSVASGAVTERASRPGVCFAAATGAALATLEMS
ncbi:MAG: hypothetical protein PHR35_06935 [Kiritimatiellae bacterium]|nr:hypothetical protein [Kiritimatiellia bacterium]